jgi:cold shock CspA family protein
VGSVEVWHDELGWGGLSSPDVPGGVWAHYSAIEGSGYRALHAGERVEFAWEPYPHEDEECGRWPNTASWVKSLEPRRQRSSATGQRVADEDS